MLLNRRMQEMRQDLHRAALSRFRTVCPAVIVADWCTLMRDGSLQLLRAALLVGGQTLPVWGEVHKDKKLSNAPIHKRFLVRLRELLPATDEQPTLIKQRGFQCAVLSQCRGAGI